MPRSWHGSAWGRRLEPAPASDPQPPSHGKDAPPRSLLKAEREWLSTLLMGARHQSEPWCSQMRGRWEGREEAAQIPSIQVFFRTLKRAVHAKWVT